MARNFIPEPLATLPWRVLMALMLLVAFAAAVLYSAAGGAMYPYAAPHVMRFVLFLIMAVAISYAPPDLVRWASYPVYGVLIVLLLLVEALGEMAQQDKSVLPLLIDIARYDTYRPSQAAIKIVKQLDPKAAADAGIR